MDNGCIVVIISEVTDIGHKNLCLMLIHKLVAWIKQIQMSWLYKWWKSFLKLLTKGHFGLIWKSTSLFWKKYNCDKRFDTFQNM